MSPMSPMSPLSPLDGDDVRLLAEVGFLAGARGHAPAARAIFGALALCRPEAWFPQVGLAMAALNRREHDEALRALDEGLRRVRAEAGRRELQALRALALQLAGRPGESQAALRAAGAHPLALALARHPAPPAPAARRLHS